MLNSRGHLAIAASALALTCASGALAHILAVTAMLVIASFVFYVR